MLIHTILNFFIGVCIFNFGINSIFGSMYMKLLFIISYIIYLIGCRIIFKKMIDKIAKDGIEKFYIKNVKLNTSLDTILDMKYYYSHEIIITSSNSNEYTWFNRYDFEKLIDKYTDCILYWDIVNYFSPIVIVYKV